MNEWMPINTAPKDGRTILVSAWTSGVMLYSEIASRAPYEDGVFLYGKPVPKRIETATHWAPMPGEPS